MELKDWLILCLIVGGSVYYWLRRRPGRISGAKAGKSSSRARTVLEEAGYEIVRIKPSVTVRMEIDGRPYPFEMKADFLVSRKGRRYLVRIRRDSKQARLQSKMWRGAHLRDTLAFRADGILVLNLEKETVQEVHFRI